jgi:hypothetical protein
VLKVVRPVTDKGDDVEVPAVFQVVSDVSQYSTVYKVTALYPDNESESDVQDTETAVLEVTDTASPETVFGGRLMYTTVYTEFTTELADVPSVLVAET